MVLVFLYKDTGGRENIRGGVMGGSSQILARDQMNITIKTSAK